MKPIDTSLAQIGRVLFQNLNPLKIKIVGMLQMRQMSTQPMKWALVGAIVGVFVII